MPAPARRLGRFGQVTRAACRSCAFGFIFRFGCALRLSVFSLTLPNMRYIFEKNPERLI
jgi:hypothetical protein